MNGVQRLGACVVVLAAVTLVDSVLPSALDRTAMPAPRPRVVLAPDRAIADRVEALTDAARNQLAMWFGLRRR